MKRRSSFTLTALATFVALGVSVSAHAQQTTLRVFSGGANQRPDLMRKLFDQYQAKNPSVKIEIEGLSAGAQRVHRALGRRARHPDAIADATELTAVEVQIALVELATRGAARPADGGWIRVK